MDILIPLHSAIRMCPSEFSLSSESQKNYFISSKNIVDLIKGIIISYRKALYLRFALLIINMRDIT